MQAIVCQPEMSTHTVEFWAPLAISAAGIPLCCVFAFDSMKRYARIMFSSNKSTAAPAMDRGKRQENGSGSASSSSSDGNHTMRSCGSDAERNFPQPRRASISAQPFADQTPLTAVRHSLVSFATSSMRIGKRLWPKTTNQLLVTTSLLCWITMCIDQLFVIGYHFSVSVLCPQWACRNATPTITPGCPASIFVRTLPGLNSLGLFFYASGAIHRFVRVYSTMSPIRHLISRICSALIVLVLVARLASLAMLSYVRFIPTPNTVVAIDDRLVSRIAGPVYTGVFTVFFTAVLAIDVVCTGLSVHFVLDCRARLGALVLESAKAANARAAATAVAPVIVGTAADGDQSPLVPLHPASAVPANDCRRHHSTRRASFTVLSATHAATAGGTDLSFPPPAVQQQTPHHRPSVASLASPSTLPRSTGGSFSSGIIVTVPSLKRAATREKKHKRMKAIVSRILLVTAVKFAIFGLFALVRFTPLVEGKLSARVVDSCLQLTLKLVIAAATVGITYVTRLVALRN